MFRTSVWSVALFILTQTQASPAQQPKADDRPGFRVYSVSLRCQTRTLLGVYPAAGDAFLAAARQRAKSSPARVEVTTGTEGKKVPTADPVLYHVWTKGCSRSPWQRGVILMDRKKADEAVKTFTKNGGRVEIVADHAPPAVFYVYGVRCRGLMHLQSTHVTLYDAFHAADELRTKQNFRCEVRTGTKGQEIVHEAPVEYKVYLEGGRCGWRLIETTKEQKRAYEVAAARQKERSRVEVVHHYASK